MDGAVEMRTFKLVSYAILAVSAIGISLGYMYEHKIAFAIIWAISAIGWSFSLGATFIEDE